MTAMERAAYVAGMRRAIEVAKEAVREFQVHGSSLMLGADRVLNRLRAHWLDAATPETPDSTAPVFRCDIYAAPCVSPHACSAARACFAGETAKPPLIDSPRPGTPTTVGAAGATEQSARSVSAGSNPAPGTVSAETPAERTEELCNACSIWRRQGRIEFSPNCALCQRRTGLRDGGRAETREEAPSSPLVPITGGQGDDPASTAPPSGTPPSPEPVPTPEPLSVECPLCGALPGARCTLDVTRNPYTPVPTHSRRIAAARRPAPEPARPPVARERAHALLYGSATEDGDCSPAQPDIPHERLCDRLTRNEQAWQGRVEALEREVLGLKTQRNDLVGRVQIDHQHLATCAASREAALSRLDTAVKLLREAVPVLVAFQEEAWAGSAISPENEDSCEKAGPIVKDARTFLAEYDRERTGRL